LGEKHPLLATSLNNWVRLLQGKGDYAGAEKYYSQALTLLEETKPAKAGRRLRSRPIFACSNLTAATMRRLNATRARPSSCGERFPQPVKPYPDAAGANACFASVSTSTAAAGSDE